MKRKTPGIDSTTNKTLRIKNLQLLNIHLQLLNIFM